MKVSITALQNLVKAIPDPACFVDVHLTLLCSNHAFVELSGFDGSARIDGMKLQDCIRAKDPWHESKLFTRPLHEKDTAFCNAIPVKNSSQRVVMASMRSVPFFDDQGDVAAVLMLASAENDASEPGSEIISLIEHQERRLKEFKEINTDISTSNTTLKALVEEKDRRLLEANKTLQRVKDEISEELQMAKNVQDSLMPRKLPDFINLSVSSIYMPAAMVGGDFFDLVSTKTRKIAILIFDVSGHGVPAALIGATAKMLFAHYIEVMESPAKIFHEVNTKICSFLKTEHYLTAFLGIMDPVQNKMVYSRAGHVKPVVYHASNKSVSTLDSRGFFIGHTALEDIAEYGEEVIFFEPGDKILFYTDGLTEGYNQKNELYGRERLIKKVQATGELDPDGLLQEILDDQIRFRNGRELRDDFTMLCVQIKDTGSILKESGFVKEDAPNSTIIYTINEIENVCAIILRAMDQCGFTDLEIKRTRVCIVEMIINGIMHGNKEDPNKKIIILYTVDHEKVRISVIDEGEGFDYRHLPNPLLPENLLKESGRGLFIVKKFMNEMRFNDRGNRIFAVKYHGG